ncbi:GNAT family N-acetyltransferase [Brevundimonas sp.]|uniref:GNAT family N-acetyltransferase n=1 Tax=Brevundimonas sp. TaxID=1871086 RepID=UPI0025E63726|nr:GNAT family N-acetyltransferase [Brevundimonas sp.]
MSELSIRDAGLNDIPALHALIEGAYRGEGSRRGWTTEADLLGGQRTDPEALAAILVDPKQAILMAERDGALVGCVLIADRGGDTGYLGMLSVDPELQSGGIGRALVRAAEREVQARWGARRLEMQVFWQRDSLIAWYARQGYEPTGETCPFPMHDPRLGVPLRNDLWFVVLARELASSPA